MTRELQAGRICTTFVPVKSSRVVVASLLSAVHVSVSLGYTISLDDHNFGMKSPINFK